MKKIILILLSFSTWGCSTLVSPINMPGRITESISAFDGTNNILMEPAWVIGKKGFKMGIEKNSGIEKLVLTIIVMSKHKFSDKDAIQFNIDGNVLSMDPVNDITDTTEIDGRYMVGEYFNSGTLSSKKFWITKDIVRRLIDGKKVGIRVMMESDETFDGDFSKDYQYGMGAKTAFRKFYKKVFEDVK
jgi:hypothetical protein